MHKSLLALVMLLSLVIPTSGNSDDWTAVANKVLASILYVETEDGSCTGFVIDAERKYVMTANHCDSGDSNKVWMDRVQGTIISKDSKKDMAVFEVKNLDSKHPALKLALKDPEVGQEVMSAGFGMGLERPIVRKAMVSDTALQINEDGIGGPFIALDSAFVGGQSGGPVVNSKGEVVMIVQRASGTVGIGMAASVIRERMGRFWGVEPVATAIVKK